MTRRRLAAAPVVALALLAGALTILPAEAAKPRESARYAGKTRQGYKIALRTSADGKRIKRLKVSFDITCRRRRDNLTSVRRSKFKMTENSIKIHADGSFNGSIKVRRSGYEVRGGRVNLNGHFHSRRRAGGTVQERLRLAEGLRCNSGDINFTARFKRRR